MATYSAEGVLFPHLGKKEKPKSTFLPFWLQPFRDNLAVLRITQFNQ
jgi:hypothetical protein